MYLTVNHMWIRPTEDTTKKTRRELYLIVVWKFWSLSAYTRVGVDFAALVRRNYSFHKKKVNT